MRSEKKEIKGLQLVTVTDWHTIFVNNIKGLTDQESKRPLIWLQLSARLVNRDTDLLATTDSHHQPVWVHTQRPGKDFQAKQNESLRAQISARQKLDRNRNNRSHSLYSHPYALNHIQLVT